MGHLRGTSIQHVMPGWEPTLGKLCLFMISLELLQCLLTATPLNIQAGSMVTGVQLYKRDVFSENDFLKPSITRPQQRTIKQRRSPALSQSCPTKNSSSLVKKMEKCHSNWYIKERGLKGRNNIAKGGKRISKKWEKLGWFTVKRKQVTNRTFSSDDEEYFCLVCMDPFSNSHTKDKLAVVYPMQCAQKVRTSFIWVRTVILPDSD